MIILESIACIVSNGFSLVKKKFENVFSKIKTPDLFISDITFENTINENFVLN